MGTISIEQLPSMLNNPQHTQTTIIADDPFLSFFAEKKIKEQNTEELVKKFINKLMRSKNECKMNDE